MNSYHPLAPGPFSSSVRTQNRLLLFGMLRWYEEISSFVIFWLIVLIILPILHYNYLFILWPFTYALCSIVKFCILYEARMSRETRRKLFFRFFLWLQARITSFEEAFIGDKGRVQAWVRSRGPYRVLAICLTLVAVIFVASIRFAYAAQGLQIGENNATWLVFGPPIWLMARSNSRKREVVVLTCGASIANLVTYGLATGSFSPDTIHPAITQSLWLVLVCLLPVILTRYISDRGADLNTVINVLDHIARIRTPANQEFANEAANIIAREFSFQEVHIFIAVLHENNANEVLSLIGSASESGHKLVKKGFYLEKKVGRQAGITSWAAMKRDYCLVNDVSNDPEKRFLFHEDFLDIQAGLAVPILLGDELIGVLDVESKNRKCFNWDDVRLLQAIATHLAIALDNAQNLARVKGLYTISRSITKRLLSQQELYPVLHSIVTVAREVLLADVVILYPYNPEKRAIGEPIVAGEPRTYTSSARRVHESNNSAVVQAIELGEPQFDTYMQTSTGSAIFSSKDVLYSNFAEREDIQSTAILPLRLGTAQTKKPATDTLGVMFVSYRNLRSFTAEHKEWCMALVDLAALVLQNALLHDSLIREERKHLRSELHHGSMQDAAITRMLLERIVDTFEQTGQVNKKQLLLALKSSQSLNRQVNYLVESWKDPAIESGLFIELQEYAAAVQRNFEVTCRCSCNGTDYAVLPAVQHEVYMVTREAVYNAVRHGRATDIRIDLDAQDRELRLTITDNGTGFDVQKVLKANGVGTIFYREASGVCDNYYRLERLGGTVSIESELGHGTVLQAVIPLSIPTAADSNFQKDRLAG